MLAALAPPWLVFASLLGVISAAATYMLVGRRLAHLAWYAIIGLLAANLGQAVASGTSAPNPVSIGDVNVLMACAAASGVVLLARVRGL